MSLAFRELQTKEARSTIRRALLLLSLTVGGCGQNERTLCQAHDDCPLSVLCRDGVCDFNPGAPGYRCTSAEVCDGLDNNCNGRTDEGAVGQGRECDTGELGVCALGTTYCDGELGIRCRPNIEPSPERCDGLDNDCNGPADEGVGQGKVCETGEPGICSAGTTYCDTDLGIRCRRNVEPKAEDCDGVDDDCDGQTDEGFGQGEYCKTGEPGVCSAGTEYCDGESGIRCLRNVEPDDEACDGVDNDCDGQTDEGFGQGESCDTGEPGVCAFGTEYCEGQNRLQCRRDIEPSGEVCNFEDQDCDGVVDNPPLFADGIPLPAVELVIPRIAWSGTVYGVAWQGQRHDSLAYFSIISGDDLFVLSTIPLSQDGASVDDVVWNGECFLVVLNEDTTRKLLCIPDNGEATRVIMDSPSYRNLTIAVDNGAAGLVFSSRDNSIEFVYLSLDGQFHAVGLLEIGSNRSVHELFVAWNGHQYGVLWVERVGTSEMLMFSLLSNQDNLFEPPIRISADEGLHSIALSAGELGEFFVVYVTVDSVLMVFSVMNGVASLLFADRLCGDNSTSIHRIGWNEDGLDVLLTCGDQLNISRFSSNGELFTTIPTGLSASRADFVWTRHNYAVVHSHRSDWTGWGFFLNHGQLGCAAAIPCADCEQE